MGSPRTAGFTRLHRQRDIYISNLCLHQRTEATENPGGPKQTHLSFAFSVTPYYHALNSCFFAQIWVIVRMPQAAANSELPCPQLSAGEMKFETATPRPGRDRGCGGAKTIHLSFGFLRGSVPPWCKGFVFGAFAC